MKQTIILAICALTAGIAPALAETFDFSQPLTLSPTEAAGTWYPDRFPPAGFASQSTAPDGTVNTVKESIDASQTQSSSFYDTQGRKYDLTGDTGVAVQLFVSSAWQTQTNEREAGFWATGVDGSGNVQDYPIIEFQTAGAYGNPGVAGFYGWNNTGGGSWQLITATDFTYGGWATLSMSLTQDGGIDYVVNGTSLVSPEAGPDTGIANVMLQGYNGWNGETAQSQDIYWNNLNASPEPGTIATMIGGLALVGLGIRRRKATPQS